MTKQRSKSAMASFMDANFKKEDHEIDTKSEDVSAPKRQSIFSSDSFMDTLSNNIDHTDGSLSIISVHPDDCKLWEFADRRSEEMGDIEALAESMKTHGQQQPILIRSNSTKTKHKYEVVFGNRRWNAAKYAGIKLTAVKKELNNKDAGLVQKQENENRKDLSDYSRALNYKSQIDGGVYSNEKELASHLGISKQTLNDIMAYIRVPKKLRDKITGYSTLSKKMVAMLSTLSKNNEYLDILMVLSSGISTGKVTTSNIEKKVKNYLHTEPKEKKEVYFKNDPKGKLLYEIKEKSDGKVHVIISKSLSSEIDCEMLNNILIDALDKAKIE
jgi:ParB family transcriptional regulator, chromosome partitioning protein